MQNELPNIDRLLNYYWLHYSEAPQCELIEEVVGEDGMVNENQLSAALDQEEHVINQTHECVSTKQTLQRYIIIRLNLTEQCLQRCVVVVR